MSKYQDLLEFIFIEEESITTSKESMVFSIILLVLGLSITIYITYRIYQQKTILTDYSEIFHPIFMINITFCFRFAISVIDYSVWYYTKGDYSLNGVFETLTWLFIIYYVILLINSKKLIKIPIKREQRFKQIILMLRILLFGTVLITIVNNFFFANYLFEVIFIAFFLIIIIFFIYEVWREKSETKSKIMRIRLQMIFLAWIGIFGYVFAFVIGYGLFAILYPEGIIPGGFHSLVALSLTIPPIISSLGFYYSLFIPNWMRKRYGLIIPESMLK